MGKGRDNETIFNHPICSKCNGRAIIPVIDGWDKNGPRYFCPNCNKFLKKGMVKERSE